MATKKQHLSEVELDEISLVDRGAAQGAKVVLLKRDSATDEVVHKATAGLQFNLGFPADGGASTVQSVIFDSKLWDKAKAEAWLKDHDMVSDKVDETANTLRYRQADPADFARFRVIKPGAQASKLLQIGKAKGLNRDDSWSSIQEEVSDAIREKFGTKTKPMGDGMPAPMGLWIRDMFEDSAVFDQDGDTWRVDYTLDYDEQGEMVITLGEKVAVEVVYQNVGKAADPPSELEPPAVSAETLIRMGKLMARVELLGNKIKKFSHH